MFPRARVVVLTDRDDMEAIMGAAASGASGILSKRTDPDSLLAAIRNASSGAVVIDRAFIEGFDARLAAMAQPHATTQPSPLTPRETEVLTMLSKGIHVSEIARELRISVHTTRGHVKKILAKVESHSQLEAVVKAAARGWLPEHV
jgi:DNA-binding NarL/FixJ family response regulator